MLLTIADIAVFVTVFTVTLILRPPDALISPFLAAVAASVTLRHVGLIVFWRDVSRCATPRSSAPLSSFGASRPEST